MAYPETEEDWLACLGLPEYHAKIPTGHILTIAGDELWVDGNGDPYTRDQYMIAHPGVDPAVVWVAIKRYRKEHGPGVRVLKE